MNDVRIRVRRPDPASTVIESVFDRCPVIHVPVDDRVVMGVDPSLTSTGLGMIYNGRLRATSLSPRRRGPEVVGAERLAWFRDEFTTMLNRYRPDMVFIEGYSFGSAVGRERLGELGGVLRLALHDAKMPFEVIQPTSLKLFVTGKGNSAKDTLSKEVFKRFGVDLTDNNEVDAAGLAIMALAYIRDDVVTTEFQRRALDKVNPGAKSS